MSSGSLGPNYIIDHRVHACGVACCMCISAAIFTRAERVSNSLLALLADLLNIPTYTVGWCNIKSVLVG